MLNCKLMKYYIINSGKTCVAHLAKKWTYSTYQSNINRTLFFLQQLREDGDTTTYTFGRKMYDCYFSLTIIISGQIYIYSGGLYSL